ncbi:hypothetical protein [Scleromatobacter humisilvae]|uniref:FecR protein domain-containing protein n=1 Tax=Scleromatobacter humisilvae TaxID=2897159 RepID=A0A9X1YIT0_9BURK|nr:hypothetical protein [Scleromatobacter humisilvae]MCK9685630.1 hypothetical protein [Scleromatobacter humisilvae]
MPSNRLRHFLAALLAGCALAAAAAPRAPLVTMLDGDATLLRDGARFALAEGVRLQAGDLLATGPNTRLLRIEFAGGLGLAFGPGSRAMITPDLGNDMRGGVYLLSGWVKLAAPAGVSGAVRSRVADTDTTAGTLILSVQPDAAEAFAETGPSRVQPRAPDAPAQALKSGEMLTLPTGGKPVLAKGASPAFVQAMPRTFMDSLPSRLDKFSADVPPRKLGDMSYADAQPWIDAEPPLRRVFAERWRRLAAVPQFRSGLVEGLKSHPEWTPILYPPPPPRAPSAAAAH